MAETSALQRQNRYHQPKRGDRACPHHLFSSPASLALYIAHGSDLRLVRARTAWTLPFAAARADLPVRALLESKIRTFEKFFWRTRFVVYAANPLAIHAFFYGFGLYKGLPNDPDYTSILYQVDNFCNCALRSRIDQRANKIYFTHIYKPAYNRLKDLYKQLKGIA